MLRFGYAVMVGAFVACSLFACGDKLNPKGNAPTGAGGSAGQGGTTDTGGFDGGVSEAGAGGAGGSTTVAVTYSGTIKPMMAASCAISGCHSGSSPLLGIGLDTYDGVKTNAASSNTAIQAGTMPIGSGAALTAADKKNFQDWVNAGTPNN